MNLDRLRAGPFREGAFTSGLHDTRNAAWLGVALGCTFALCFATGVLSHLIQYPPAWFRWPSRPAWGYRLTQGIHVAAGLATIPLLAAKLFTVYPKLFAWPPLHGIAHAVERAALLPLVGGAVFLVASGTANIALWYPWSFFFPAAHYWAAWITVGAMIVHVGAKAAVVRSEIGRPREPEPAPVDGLSRRGFLAVTASAVGIVTVATVGQTVPWLRRVSLLAPRVPDVGPQGFPVNKTARAAGVLASARDPSWTLWIHGRVRAPMRLSLDDLRRMPQRTAVLPIACVEGWSASATWTGVRVGDLLALAGARPNAEVVVGSLQPRGLYRASALSAGHASDPDTLLALEVNGSALDIEHGYPCRLIGPNRPGVMQTKWVSTLEVR